LFPVPASIEENCISSELCLFIVFFHSCLKNKVCILSIEEFYI
jgi:hypothetical protein